MDGEHYEKMFARNVPHSREKLKAAKVAIAGVGGLGSNVAVMLARAGVGELLLVDFDVVEPSNLNRQHYDFSHIGAKKTVAIKEQLSKINPLVKIKTVDTFITKDNVVKLFEDYDIVCEAFDNPNTKAMLVSTLLSSCPNVKIVAASGMAGIDSANNIKTSERFGGRLYVCGDETSDFNAGLMSARVAVCAGHQANTVLRLILGEIDT